MAWLSVWVVMAWLLNVYIIVKNQKKSKTVKVVKCSIKMADYVL